MNNYGMAIGENLKPVAFDPATLETIYEAESGARFSVQCSTRPDMYGYVITAECWKETLGYLPMPRPNSTRAMTADSPAELALLA